MPVDVLLINAFCLAHDPVEQRLMEPYFPLGMLYIASALREAGYTVAIYDNCFAPDLRGCQEAIARHQPRVVGLNALNTTRRLAQQIGRWARHEGYPVVFGGPDPTSRPAAYVEDQEGGAPADIVVIGEGEATIVEVMALLTGKAPAGGAPLRLLPLAPEAHDGATAAPASGVAVLEAPAGDPALDAIAGIAYRGDGGHAVITAPRPNIANLDALPFPAWDLIDLGRYRRAWVAQRGFYSMSLITSRGCPFGCNWCSKPVFGRAYRLRSPQNVVAEMVWLKRQFAPDAVRIVDDIFGLNRRWLDKWHQEVLAQDAALPFECLSRTDLVKAGTLAKLKEAGCRKIFFGAESGSQPVLDAMNKGIAVEDTLLAARAMRETGLAMHFYIMVGYPGEEPSDIAATVAMLRECAPDSMSVSVAYPLPGTEFYERVRDHLVPDHDWKYSSENSLLFRRDKYSTLFYRWSERLLNKEWQAARWRYTGPPGPARRLRVLAERHICRSAVALLGRLQGGPMPFRPAGAAP